ncbi:type I-E CRISPR-associated protein Cas5/CasD [Rhodocaloribacter litoris]|uniref:type I-E CRISPR-associated protein Cas5/CasD n=1 Tax=Rhodocaloribacter litoris TaxID=2558931 RepID=UPI00141F3D69|nr:type I-E CRISPR-associated protein Cas5/CasD [Rhodocaloribacter litoris]QXD16412.1 type I-E CRISPR-associated protein Cas5/CasD [Rhodocaloribacter litoris]
MTYTLLLRLAAPLQAWGLQSRFSIRDTAREPTKSGVLGLVCAALGRPCHAAIDDLRALRLAVRVDREGLVRRDFHTAQNVLIASNTARQIERGRPKLKDTEPSVRYYLADAWFTVALAGPDRNLLQAIDVALGAPRWPLALGRKACVPGWPVRIVQEDGTPLGPLAGHPLEVLRAFRDPLGDDAPTAPEDGWRFVLDADVPHPALRVAQIRIQPDDPLSFHNRRFLPRRVVVGFASPTGDAGVSRE